MFRIVVVCTVVLICCSSTSQAKIEKWVDENGKTHYGSRAPKGSEVESIKTPKYHPSQTGVKVKQERVVLYSTSWCPYCRKARAYLNRNGITFTEYDIEKDVTAKRNYDSAGGRGVPFLVKGNKAQGGFNTASYDSFFKP